ncbi:MAG: hypothetical protein ACE5MI_12200, partial [Acidimicrobiia bacterium]
MTDALRAGKQVLLVARDDGFLEEATRLLGDHEVVRADSIAQARDLMAGGDVDIVLLGPSFGYEEAVVEAGTLVAADPSALVVLVANLSTNRMLTAAIRAGLADLVNTPLTDRKIAEVMSRTDHSESPEVPPETDLEVPEEVVEAAEGPAEAETPFELDEEQSWTTSPDAVETLEPRAPEIEAEPEEDGAADTDPALIWNSQPSAETLWTAVEAPAAPDQVDSDALPWLADTQEAVLEVDRVAAPTEPEGPFEELDESADYEFADYDPFAPMEPAAGLDIAVEEAVEEAQPAEPDLFAPIEPAAEPDIAVEEAVEEAQPAATLEPDVATPPSLYSSLTELEEDSDLDLHLPEVPPETDLEVPEEVVEAAEGPAEAETPFELDEEQSWTTSPDAVETLEPRAPEIEAEPEEDGAADTDPALIWNSQPSAETLWTAVEAPAAPDQVDSDALPWLADTQEAVLEVDRVAAPTEPEGPFEELDESADYEFADYDPFAPMEPAAGLDIAVEEAVEEAQPAEPDLFAPIEPAAEPDIAVEEAVEEAQPAATLEPDVATPPSLYSSLTELEEDSDLDLHLPEVPPETDLEVPEPAAPEPPVVEEVAEEEAPKAGKGRSGTNLKEKMEEVHDIFASLAPVREETRAPDSFWERLLTAKLETTEAETQAETEAETDAQIEAETGDPYTATRVERVTPKKLR